MQERPGEEGKRIELPASLLHALPWRSSTMKLLSKFLPGGVLALLLCCSATAQQLGQPAPAITLEHAFQGPSAETITMESLRGKLLVLEFWATW
jgi:hypothetical protein